MALFIFYYIFRTGDDRHHEEGAGSKHNEDHHNVHGHKDDKVSVTLRFPAIDVQAVVIYALSTHFLFFFYYL